MSEEQEQRRPAPPETAPESWRGRHPGDEGEPPVPPAVPEDEDIVPNRHSASAEAAWLRWRESHEES
jgi:hypothetical protein